MKISKAFSKKNKISKNIVAKRKRRSPNIRPEPVFRSSKLAVANRNINNLNVLKIYKTPRQALADINSGDTDDTISLAPNHYKKFGRNNRKIRPPPPPFVEVGNQTYKVNHFYNQSILLNFYNLWVISISYNYVIFSVVVCNIAEAFDGDQSWIAAATTSVPLRKIQFI